MKILKISLIPEKKCNQNVSHFDQSDPINLWLWDGGQYYYRNSPLSDIPHTYLSSPENDDISLDDLNYNDYEYRDIRAKSTEITILTDKSKEVFSLDEITFDSSDAIRIQLKIKYFEKEIYENFNLKEITYFKEILTKSIDFTKSTMRELIFNNQENLDDESLIKNTLEKYLEEIEDIVQYKTKEIQERLDEYGL